MPGEDEETVTHERFEPEEEEDDPNTHEKEPGMEESKFRESQQRKPERERESLVLLDCLLLMMCEPKISMEVSKETWVWSLWLSLGSWLASDVVVDGFFWDFFCLDLLCCIFGFIWYFGYLGFDDFAGFEKMVVLKFLIFGF